LHLNEDGKGMIECLAFNRVYFYRKDYDFDTPGESDLRWKLISTLAHMDGIRPCLTSDFQYYLDSDRGRYVIRSTYDDRVTVETGLPTTGAFKWVDAYLFRYEKDGVETLLDSS